VKQNRSASAEAATQNKNKARQPAIKVGSRIKVCRFHIYHLLKPELQEYLPREHPNFYNYFGTVVKKTIGTKANYDIRLDVFRSNEIAEGIRRNFFTTLAKNSDEPEYDAKYQAAVDRELEVVDSEVKDELEYKNEAEFCKQESNTLKNATEFVLTSRTSEFSLLFGRFMLLMMK
jgi:hypothetical protein